MKTCSKCKRVKSLNEFSKKSATKDGLDYHCKSCVKKANDLNREKLREINRRSYRNNRETKIAKSKKYGFLQRGNPVPQDVLDLASKSIRKIVDHVSAYARTLEKCRERNKSRKHREYNKKWAKTDAGRLNGRLKSQRRRARVKELPSNFTKNDFDFLMWFQDGKCGNCKTMFSRKVIPEVDHIVPVVLGGEYSLANSQLLCRSCNASKYDNVIRYIPNFTSSDIEEWRSLC